MIQITIRAVDDFIVAYRTISFIIIVQATMEVIAFMGKFSLLDCSVQCGSPTPLN